jgi:protocatechuate 3,4-dioxygenase beta subunit
VSVTADGEELRAAVTGADGRYRLEHLPSGSYLVTAEASDYLSPEPRFLRLAPGDRQEHDVVLRAGVTLRGRVRDEDGKPVVDVLVVASAGHRQRHTVPSTHVNSTEEEGAFALAGMEPGRWVLMVDDPRYLPVNHVARAPGPEVELVLRRGAAFEGQVLDADGEPVEGARVMAFPNPPDDPVRVRAPVMTEAEGRFRLEGLEARPYKLIAITGGSIRRVGTTEVTARGGTTRADIRLVRGKVLRGQVVEVGGKPLQGISVFASQDRGAVPEEEAFTSRGEASGNAETDAAGRFELHNLAPGTFRLWTGSAEHQDFEITAEADAPPLTLVLTPKAKVRLRVLHEDGRPFTAFVLGGEPVAVPSGEHTFHGSTMEQTLEISAPGYASERVKVPPGPGSLEVVLRPGRRVTGQVVNARSGAPVGDAEVALSADAEGSLERLDARTGPGGGFTLSHVGDGAFVTVAKAGFRTAVKPIGPGETSVTVPLVPLSSIAGKVTAEPVVLEALSISIDGPSRVTTEVEPDGSFSAADLEVGEYTVTLWTRPAVTAMPDALPVVDTARVTVAEGAPAWVELRPRLKGATVRLRLLPAPEGVTPVLVHGHFPTPRSTQELHERLERATGLAYGPVSREGDQFVFRPLPAGHYTAVVALDEEDGSIFTEGLDVPQGGSQSVELRVPAGRPSP